MFSQGFSTFVTMYFLDNVLLCPLKNMLFSINVSFISKHSKVIKTTLYVSLLFLHQCHLAVFIAEASH